MSSEDHDERVPVEGPLRRPAWLSDLPHWTVSAVLHLILVLVLVAVVASEQQSKQEQVDITVRQKNRPPPYEPAPTRDVMQTPRILHERKIDDPIILKKPDDVTPDIPRGSDTDSQANVDLRADSINIAIGLGHTEAARTPPRGSFGARDPSRRPADRPR